MKPTIVWHRAVAHWAGAANHHWSIIGLHTLLMTFACIPTASVALSVCCASCILLLVLTMELHANSWFAGSTSEVEHGCQCAVKRDVSVFSAETCGRYKFFISDVVVLRQFICF